MNSNGLKVVVFLSVFTSLIDGLESPELQWGRIAFFLFLALGGRGDVILRGDVIIAHVFSTDVDTCSGSSISALTVLNVEIFF